MFSFAVGSLLLKARYQFY